MGAVALQASRTDCTWRCPRSHPGGRIVSVTSDKRNPTYRAPDWYGDRAFLDSCRLYCRALHRSSATFCAVDESPGTGRNCASEDIRQCPEGDGDRAGG